MPLYFTLIQKWAFTLDGNDKIVRVHVTMTSICWHCWIYFPDGLLVALFMVLYPKLDIDVSPAYLVLLESFEPLFSLKVVILAHPTAQLHRDIGQ